VNAEPGAEGWRRRAPSSRAPAHYWLLPGQLMGGEWPVPHLDWLAGQGISVLVNLTQSAYRADRFQVNHVAVRDGAAPDETQISQCCHLVSQALGAKLAVYVHCFAGAGRTGTILACYLVYAYRLAPADAIARIRRLRPGSIETGAQENAVSDWALLMRATDYQL
jgi:atypical dual specificity phosphatase